MRIRPPRVPVVTGATVGRGAVALAALWSSLGLLATAWLFVGAGRDSALWNDLDLPAVARVGLPLATASYLLRFLRWDRLVRHAAPELDARGFDLATSLRIQAAGFGLTVTPARLGELLRFYLLERHTGVPAARSATAIVVEKLSEGGGFMLLALVTGLLLAPAERVVSGQNWPIASVSLILVVGAACRVGARRGWLAPMLERAGGLIRAIAPTLAVDRLVREIVSGTWRVSGTRPVAEAVGASLAARLCDAMVLYIVTVSLGFPLSPIAAAFILGTAGAVGGISMLPGGVGAVEASMAGLLVAFGAPWPVALGAPLLTRALILWLWVALGLLVIVTTPAWRRRETNRGGV